MTWLFRIASESKKEMVISTIARLEELCRTVHELANFGVMSQSGGFQVLTNLLELGLVKSIPALKTKLNQALIGENRQKVVIDSPFRFQRLLFEAEDIVKREIGRNKTELRKLNDQ